MYTSPRTSSSGGTGYASVPSTRSGIDRIVRTFDVTFSPTTPSPRVAAVTSNPFSYTSSIASPSNFGSHTYSIVAGAASPSIRLSRASKSSTASGSIALLSDSIGCRCRYDSNSSDGGAPTRWVGDVSNASDGNSASSPCSVRNSSSYSKSLISGSSRT